ncbi:MAG: hypothetical protein FWF56_03440 [Firmicutes bacterium]|nr:hypothetical protein [Bacillota bacterium]
MINNTIATNKPLLRNTSVNPTDIGKIRIALTKSKLDNADATLNRVILSYTTDNILEYNNAADKTLDGRLHTQERIAYYRPQVQFSFNYNHVDEFSKFIQLVNRPQFHIRYYDLELGQEVIRLMQLNAVDKVSITHYGKVFGVMDINITANSILTYQAQDRDGNDIGYDDLIKLATEDDRL